MRCAGGHAVSLSAGRCRANAEVAKASTPATSGWGAGFLAQNKAQSEAASAAAAEGVHLCRRHTHTRTQSRRDYLAPILDVDRCTLRSHVCHAHSLTHAHAQCCTRAEVKRAADGPGISLSSLRSGAPATPSLSFGAPQASSAPVISFGAPASNAAASTSAFGALASRPAAAAPAPIVFGAPAAADAAPAAAPITFGKTSDAPPSAPSPLFAGAAGGPSSPWPAAAPAPAEPSGATATPAPAPAFSFGLAAPAPGAGSTTPVFGGAAALAPASTAAGAATAAFSFAPPVAHAGTPPPFSAPAPQQPLATPEGSALKRSAAASGFDDQLAPAAPKLPAAGVPPQAAVAPALPFAVSSGTGTFGAVAPLAPAVASQPAAAGANPFGASPGFASGGGGAGTFGAATGGFTFGGAGQGAGAAVPFQAPAPQASAPFAFGAQPPAQSLGADPVVACMPRPDEVPWAVAEQVCLHCSALPRPGSACLLVHFIPDMPGLLLMKRAPPTGGQTTPSQPAGSPFGGPFSAGGSQPGQVQPFPAAQAPAFAGGLGAPALQAVSVGGSDSNGTAPFGGGGGFTAGHADGAKRKPAGGGVRRFRAKRTK